MTKPSVWLATIESSLLLDVLRSLAPTLPHVYLENESRAQLAALADLLETPRRVPMPAARWTKGRAFGITLELSWRRADPLLIELHALNETGQPPPVSLGWSASSWNDRLEPLAANQARDVLLIAPAYNGGTALRCVDYRCNGVVVISRLCEVIAASPKLAQRL